MKDAGMYRQNLELLKTAGLDRYETLSPRIARALEEKSIKLQDYFGAGSWGSVFDIGNRRVIKVCHRRTSDPYNICGQNDFVLARAIMANGGTQCLPRFFDAWKLTGLTFAVREELPNIPDEKREMWEELMYLSVTHPVHGRNYPWTYCLYEGQWDLAVQALASQDRPGFRLQEYYRHLEDARALVNWCKKFQIRLDDMHINNFGYRASTNNFVLRDLSNTCITKGVKLK